MADIDATEPILNEVSNRFVLFPIRFPKVWNMYKIAESAFWTAEEVDLSKDMDDWEKLNKNEQHFIKNILAFFAGSDGIVNENLSARFMNDVKIPEAKAFYGFQIAMENVHCVAPDTEILTKEGYTTIMNLANKTTDVWNGKEFSTVLVVKTSESSHVLKVHLSNGMSLTCTPDHKWLINGQDERVLAKDLQPGMKIQHFMYPDNFLLSDQEIFSNPYQHGFLCSNPDAVYDPIMFNCRPRFFVPVNFGLKTKATWLSGLFKNATVTSENEMLTATIFTSHPDFFKHVQLLLTTMNIHAIIKYTTPETTWSLSVSGYHMKKLLEAGVSIGQDDKTREYRETLSSIPYMFSDIIVTSIEYLDKPVATYCFNEPKEHTGIFNGILTGQSEMYSLMLDQYIKDPVEKDNMFNAIQTIPCITKKANWALKWISDKDASYAKRLVAFACVEGIFFSGAFCAIFWLKEKGKMPGLCTSNEFISRDESLHTEFACLLYSMLQNKLEQRTIHEIVKEAVEIEMEFICESIPCNLLGMNSELMSQYIQFVADRLLVQLGYDTIYNVTNPFHFMDRINLSNKTNFFEHRPTEYARPQETRDFSLDEDF